MVEEAELREEGDEGEPIELFLARGWLSVSFMVDILEKNKTS